jgi:hypothetical protein
MRCGLVLAAFACSSTPKPPAVVRDLTCPGVDVLTSDQLLTQSLAVAQSSLFWVSFHSPPPTSSSGSLPADILSMPAAGGTPQVFASGNSDTQVRATNNDVFFTVGDAGDNNPTTVFRQPVTGGSATALGDYLAPRPVTDTTQAYVYEDNIGGGRVLQVDDAGALQPVVTAAQGEQIEGMVIVDTGLAFETRTLNPQKYAISYAATPGTTPVVIASGLDQSFELRAGAASVLYGWVLDPTAKLFSIQTLPVTGGTMTPLFAPSFKTEQTILLIGSTVYFVGQQSTDTDEGLFVVETNAPPKRIDCGYFSGYTLATDGTYLYWGQDDNTKASVFRMLAPGP